VSFIRVLANVVCPYGYERFGNNGEYHESITGVYQVGSVSATSDQALELRVLGVGITLYDTTYEVKQLHMPLLSF
jgi:hypothetical protein